MTGIVLKVAIYAYFLQLALKANAQAATPEPVLVNRFCRPETSATSACLWTGDCPLGGCEDRCIVNDLEGSTLSYFTLLDRAAGEEFYSACPLLAFWLNRLLDLAPARRRLQARADADRRLREAAASTAKKSWSLDPALRHVVSSARRQNDPLQGENGREANFWTMQRLAAAAARRRHLLDTDRSEAPAAAFEPRSDVPSNPCVTETDIAAMRLDMTRLASTWRQVFTSAATGSALSADLQEWENVLLYPNEFQFMIRMLEDPGRAAEYMATRCANREMQVPESSHYIYWLTAADRDRLDDDLTMVQCADNFGAFEEFDRKFIGLVDRCTPPFGVTPDCYSASSYYIISSRDCAAAYAATFNITNTAPLARIAATTEAIHTACSAVETEAECLSARSPVLQDLQDLHEGLPVPYAIEVEAEPPLAPVDPVQVVCFTPDCEDEAPAAEAPAPEAAPEAPEPSPPQVIPDPDSGALEDNGMLTRADFSAGRAPAPAATAVAAAALAIVGAGLGLLQTA